MESLFEKDLHSAVVTAVNKLIGEEIDRLRNQKEKLLLKDAENIDFLEQVKYLRSSLMSRGAELRNTIKRLSGSSLKRERYMMTIYCSNSEPERKQK